MLVLCALLEITKTNKMLLDGAKKKDIAKAHDKIDAIGRKGSKFELKEIVKYRTTLQNRALHKFFKIISDALNEQGNEFIFTGLKGNISTMYTSEIVKNHIWKVVQVGLFNVESTTKINTKQINRISDVLIKHLGENGIIVDFPRDELKELKELEESKQ